LESLDSTWKINPNFFQRNLYFCICQGPIKGTFVRVQNTFMHVEITLYVYKPHSFVLKSAFSFKNYTCANHYHIMRVVNIALYVWTSQYACKHNTLRVKIIIFVKNTIFVCKLHSACRNHTLCGNRTLRVEKILCV
jgi:hypothetical protein